MSDRNSEHEPTLPVGGSSLRRSSQRTQRYQQVQPESHGITRRGFLKGAVIGLGGLGLLGWAASRLFQTGNPESKPTPVPGRLSRTSTPESISSEYVSLKNQLHDLNQQARKDPEHFKELAPIIGSLAVGFFCKEMGYDPKNYQGKIKYLWNDEFQKDLRESSSCIINEDEYGYGRVGLDEQTVSINLNMILYDSPTTKTLQQDPGMSLFGDVVHELLHVSTPLLPDPESPTNKLRGLGVLKPDPQGNKGDMSCYSVFRQQLEEAVVEEANTVMLLKVGIGGIAPSYESWVQRYRMGVIDRFFQGDNKPLLKLQQQSNQIGFFSLVGEKLGVFSPVAQREAGEKYLATLITQGIM